MTTKSKFVKGQEVYIIGMWSKYILIKVRISDIYTDKQGFPTYKVWRQINAKRAGCYWKEEDHRESTLFATSDEAYQDLLDNLEPSERIYAMNIGDPMDEI